MRGCDRAKVLLLAPSTDFATTFDTTFGIIDERGSLSTGSLSTWPPARAPWHLVPLAPSPAMPLSHRVERISEQVREEVSQILAAEVADPGIGVITVTR